MLWVALPREVRMGGSEEVDGLLSFWRVVCGFVVIGVAGVNTSGWVWRS